MDTLSAIVGARLGDSLAVVSTTSDSLRFALDAVNQRLTDLHGVLGIQTNIVVGLTAVVATVLLALLGFNWYDRRGIERRFAELKEDTERRFAEVKENAERKVAVLASEMLRSNCELKGDVQAGVAQLCEGRGEWTYAVVYWVHSAILAASSEKWSESIARTTRAENALEMHTAEIKLTAGDVGGFRSEFGEVKDTEASAPARRRLETLLARLDNAVVRLSGTGSQPVQESGDCGTGPK